MPKFRKKPVVIEAVRWTGTKEGLDEVFDLIPKREDGTFDLPGGISFVPPMGTLDIPTLEGIMTATAGDWIIKGVQNEIYPCKPDIFEATYELVIEPLDVDVLEDDRGKNIGMTENHYAT